MNFARFVKGLCPVCGYSVNLDAAAKRKFLFTAGSVSEDSGIILKTAAVLCYFTLIDFTLLHLEYPVLLQ